MAIRDGRAAGLVLIDQILGHGDLAEYHLAHTDRADLLRRLGRTDDSCAAHGQTWTSPARSPSGVL